MKYFKPTTQKDFSLAAKQLRALVDAAEPAIGIPELARQTTLSGEALNSVLSRGRKPGRDVINSLAKFFRWSDTVVDHLMELREKDALSEKMRRASLSSNGRVDIDSITELMKTFSTDQMTELANFVVKTAKRNCKNS